MPRDASATKERLLREAERLFARRGLWQVTVREITEAAGQRNVSAMNYHFGSRERMLDAILSRHGDPIDVARGERFADVGADADTRDLMAALVLPYGASLGTPEGRDYLRIVAQMTGQFGGWRDSRPGIGANLQEILAILEGRPPGLPVDIRRERLVNMIQLMTAAMAERARAIDEDAPLPLDEPTFLANLTDVLVGVLEAPLRGALTPQ